jgi:hypothetical protein
MRIITLVLMLSTLVACAQSSAAVDNDEPEPNEITRYSVRQAGYGFDRYVDHTYKIVCYKAENRDSVALRCFPLDTLVQTD